VQRSWRLLALLSMLLVLSPAARADGPSPESTLDGVQGDKGERKIEFVGALRNRSDLTSLLIGNEGSWFPRFDADAGTGSTGENARDALPEWVSPFNHTTFDPENGRADPGCTEPGALEDGCMPTYAFRTFSQDGPAHSASDPGWGLLRLPSEECGRSGAIVDPKTFEGDEPNGNNTINRIQLQGEVPSPFYISVLTDNTARQLDPSELLIRGNVGLLDVPSEVADSQVEPSPEPKGLHFNGVPDLYVFRVSGFFSGDFLKLRLVGSDSPASFGGLLFDVDRPRDSTSDAIGPCPDEAFG